METVQKKWKQFRRTAKFHDFVLFLVFVAISTLFWVIMSLNDSAQDNFKVKIAITNCPDSVTFISDIPPKMHVTVRDRGSLLWRNHYRSPSMNINFREYANDGILRYTHSDIVSSLKNIFGGSAQIISISTDSLHLEYTTNKGRRVPVVIDDDIYPASGSVIEGRLKAEPSYVLVYGSNAVLDTIHKVHTEIVSLKDLSESTTVEAKLKRIKDARIMPSTVKIKIPVEPLVRKEALVTIAPINVPQSESMLLFPSKVQVEYYVAMSRLGDDEDDNIHLVADYAHIQPHTNKVEVEIVSYPDRLKNLDLKNDSVEYTIVRN